MKLSLEYYLLQQQGLKGEVIFAFLKSKIDKADKAITAKDILLKVKLTTIAMVYRVLSKLVEDEFLIRLNSTKAASYYLSSKYISSIEDYNRPALVKHKCRPLKYTDIMQKSS